MVFCVNVYKISMEASLRTYCFIYGLNLSDGRKALLLLVLVFVCILLHDSLRKQNVNSSPDPNFRLDRYFKYTVLSMAAK